MDTVLVLILLSLAMLVGCYLAGTIPLAFTLSEDKLQLVTVLGAGILVGTALSVIIPEGVNTLYTSQLGSIPDSHATKQADSITSAGEAHLTFSSAREAISSAHSLIGITLVLGFVFMLLVDQLASNRSRIPAPEPESGGRQQEKQKITATLGLVVHAAADGVALGAAVSTSHTDVEMIVFIAIMLHKAPAAFGLVTFLLHEGLDRNRIRRHLLIFALSAPVMAIVTYLCISQSTKETLSTYHATGVAMLFSAGTFLYVATVHVLPEVIISQNNESKGLRKMELLCLVGGAVLPVFLTLGHHHH